MLSLKQNLIKNFQIHSFSIENYNIRNRKHRNKHGGGLVEFVQKRLICKKLETPKNVASENIVFDIIIKIEDEQ